MLCLIEMSSIAFITFSVKLTKREADIFKVIMARYDTILDQSERENLHDHLSNSTKRHLFFLFAVDKARS